MFVCLFVSICIQKKSDSAEEEMKRERITDKAIYGRREKRMTKFCFIFSWPYFLVKKTVGESRNIPSTIGRVGNSSSVFITCDVLIYTKSWSSFIRLGKYLSFLEVTGQRHMKDRAYR